MDNRTEPRIDAFKPGRRAPLFFMHIPKTAGMSMRQYLNNQYQAGAICPADRWQDLLDLGRDVASYDLVRGHFRHNLRQLTAPGTRVLVVLREPLRRTVSALRHLGRDPNFHQTYELARNLTPGEMIRTPRIMALQRDVQARFLCASRTADDVTAYLRDARTGNRNADAGDRENPPAFQLAADRLETIDFVGTTEDLGTLVSAMAQEMKFHPPVHFPVVNENPERIDPLPGLTDEELAIVYEHNTIDLQLYDFARRMLKGRSFDRSIREMVRNGVYQVPPASFEIEMSGIIPGSGWYAAESAGQTSWRWTGPGRRFTLEVPLRQDVSYRFDMTFSDPRPAGPGDITVEVNDYPMAFELWSEGHLFRCAIVIEQGMLARSDGICRIEIDTGETSQPSASDLRQLGISVQKVEFICLEP
jgi:Sulfotransferase family